MSNYEVVVGNVGTVYDGGSSHQASQKYKTYVAHSKSGVGRAAHEDVTMIVDGAIVREYTYTPPLKVGERILPTGEVETLECRVQFMLDLATDKEWYELTEELKELRKDIQPVRQRRRQGLNT